MNLDALELELRRIPGVYGAGFEETDGTLYIQVQVGAGINGREVAALTTRAANRAADKPVAVEIVRWREFNPQAHHQPEFVMPEDYESTIDLRSPEGEDDWSGESRVRLLAVLAFPDTDEIEVHITHKGSRSIGRSNASHGLAGSAEATLDAVHEFLHEMPYRVSWVHEVEQGTHEGFTVALALEGTTPPLYGIATGGSPLEATARATLQALNRSLSRELTVV